MRLTALLKCSSLLLALCCVAVPVGCSDAEFVTISKSPGEFASRLCGNVDTEAPIQLTCPLNTWFHVLMKISSNEGISNCSSGTMYPQTNRAIPNSASSPALAADCRGRNRTDPDDPQVCHERFQLGRDLNSSNVRFFEVSYECINVTEDVQYNMCERLSLTVTPGDLYLASPSFFFPPTSDDLYLQNITCHCNLTSESDDFKAHALYLSQPEDWNMTCGSCERPFGFPAVNVDLIEATRVFYVEFLPYSESRSAVNELWIHVSGSNSIHLQCNNGSASTPSSSISTGTDGISGTPTVPPTTTPVTTSPGTNPTLPSPTVPPTTTPVATSPGTNPTLPSPTVAPTTTPVTTFPDGALVFLGFLGGATCTLLLGVVIYWIRRHFQIRKQSGERSTELDTHIPTTIPESPKGAGYDSIHDVTSSSAEIRNVFNVAQPAVEREGDTNTGYTVLNLYGGDDVSHHRSPAILSRGGIQKGEDRSPNTRKEFSNEGTQQSSTGPVSQEQRAVSDDEVNVYMSIDDVMDDASINRVDDDGYLVPITDDASTRL